MELFTINNNTEVKSEKLKQDALILHYYVQSLCVCVPDMSASSFSFLLLSFIICSDVLIQFCVEDFK